GIRFLPMRTVHSRGFGMLGLIVLELQRVAARLTEVERIGDMQERRFANAGQTVFVFDYFQVFLSPVYFVAAAYSPAIMVHQRFVFRIGSSCVQDHGPAGIWVFDDPFGVAMPLDDFHPEDVSENGKSLVKTAAFIVTFYQLRSFQHGVHSRTFGATCSMKRRIDARAWSLVKPPRAKFPAKSVRYKRSRTYSTFSWTSSALPASTRFRASMSSKLSGRICARCRS